MEFRSGPQSPVRPGFSQEPRTRASGNLNLIGSCTSRRVAASPVWVESLQLLQEDVAVADGVVRVRHDEELEDGASAGTQEQDRPVPGRSGLCVHHNLVQLVPSERKQNTVSVRQSLNGSELLHLLL